MFEQIKSDQLTYCCDLDQIKSNQIIKNSIQIKSFPHMWNWW